MIVRSLDTEVTGLDFRHGARPYLVTMGIDKETAVYWEWQVNPKTRRPIIPDEDLDEIEEYIDEADIIVMHNAKFDVPVLGTVRPSILENWNWEKTHDTTLSAHLLKSNILKDLTSQCSYFLGVDISGFEAELAHACQRARTLTKSLHPDWMIAHKSLVEEMPSAKETLWKFDMWLLKALIDHDPSFPRKYPEAKRWHELLALYANMDSLATINLYHRHQELIEENGLGKIYQIRRKLLKVVCDVEQAGVTLDKNRLDEIETRFQKQADSISKSCVGIAARKGFELELPDGGRNNSLEEFIFNVLKLPVVALTDKGNPSLNDKSVGLLLEQCEQGSPAKYFLNKLRERRKAKTALSYIASYRRFSLELDDFTWILHPSLNMTGSNTLRWTSSNPNEQNISKKKGFNLRYAFGPAPGREWWSLDANNIELRIPAFEAGEEEMIAIFERPNDPPYYGSYHLLVFDTLHPELFAQYGKDSKNEFASSWYQWTKNGNFAVQYGSVEESGTADAAYHMPGAFAKIKSRFKRIHGPGGLNESMINHARKTGYVETMPDKTIDPGRGYPLWCKKTDRGGILPTVPLSYHVQGTAMWWMMLSMLKCKEYLDAVNARSEEKYYMIMQVHDEIVFDFPAPSVPMEEPWRYNLSKIKIIKKLMESSGDGIGIPTPVGVDYHANNWGESIGIPNEEFIKKQVPK